MYQSRIYGSHLDWGSDALNGYTHTADEGRNQGDASLGTSNSLAETEEESEVAVNAVLSLELLRRLDTLPGRGDLDQDTLALDTDRLVKGNEVLGLRLGCCLVEGQLGVNLSGNTARDDRENLLAELDELRERVSVVPPCRQ